MAFSPDGQLLASTSDDFTIKLWRVADATLLRTLKGHDEDVQSVAFSPDGKVLYSGGKDNTIRAWRIPNGTILNTVSEGAVGWPITKPRHALALSPRGDWIATGRTFSDQSATKQLGVLQLRNPGDLELLQEFFLTNAQIRSVAFSADGKRLAAGTEVDPNNRGRLLLWRLTGGTWEQLIPPPMPDTPSGLESVAFSPSGDRLAGSRNDAVISIWRTTDWMLEDTLTNGFAREIVFSSDGRALAAAGQDDLTLWDLATRRISWVQTGRNSFRTVAFSPDGIWLATGTKDDQVALWPRIDGQSPRLFTAHAEPVTALVFSPDGRKLVSWAGAPEDNSIKVWDTRDGALLWSTNAYAGDGIAFSPDSQTLFLGVAMRFFNAEDGSERPEGVSPSAPVTAAAFPPAGHVLALGTADWQIELWQLSDGTLRRRLTNYFGPVGRLAFSSDGQYLVSAGEKYAPPRFDSVKFWRLSDGSLVTNVLADTFAFSDDGLNVALVKRGSADGLTIYRWAAGPGFLQPTGTFPLPRILGVSPDLASAVSTGENVMDFQKLDDEFMIRRYDEEVSRVTAFTFTPDGRFVAYGRDDASLILARSPFSAPINASQPPALIVQPRSEWVDEGEEAVLWVKAAGAAPLSCQWHFNSEPLAGATNFMLMRSPATTAHAGTYSVTVRNPFGSVTSGQVTLGVSRPPVVTSQPKDQKVTFGGMASFNVSASSAEPFTFQWRFNGHDIPNATNDSFTLDLAGPEHSGDYSVLVTGRSGASKASAPARLMVQMPLSPLWSVPYTAESAAFTPDGSGITATSPTWSGSQHGATRTGTQVGRWRVSDATSLGFRTVGGVVIPIPLVSADGSLAARLDGSGVLQLWGVAENALAGPLLTNQPVLAKVFSLDGSLLAAATATNLILWGTRDATVLHRIALTNTDPTTLAFSPDGTLLAMGNQVSLIHVWQTEDARLRLSLKQPVYGRISLAISPDNTLLATGGDDRLIRLWRLADGELLRTMTGAFASISAITFSRDGALIAAIKAGQVELWRTADAVLLPISGSAAPLTPVQSVAFSPTANLLLFGGPGLLVVDYSVDLNPWPLRLRINPSLRPWMLSIDTVPGRSHAVLVSSNLVDWAELAKFVSTNLTHQIYDPGASYPQRFYRAICR